MNSSKKTIYSLVVSTTLASMSVSCMDILQADAAGDVARIQTFLATVPEDQRMAYLMQHDKQGNTPLHWAAYSGYARAIQTLLGALPKDQRMAYLMQQNNYGNTPLHLAVSNGYAGAIQLVASKKCAEVIQALLAYVPEDRRMTYMMQRDISGNTSLHRAVSDGRAGVIQALLGAMSEAERMACLMQQNLYCHAPLHWAALNGHEEAIQTLIAAGADLNLTNAEGRTSEQLARDSRHPEIVALLADYEQRIKDWPQQAKLMTQAQAAAMAQGLHPRLGSKSPIALLPQYVLQEIMTHVYEENKKEAARRARLPRQV